MPFHVKIVLVSIFAVVPFVANGKDSSDLKKDLSFDEILIKGKHHFNDEAVVTVEEDKVLNALLEVRKDFKDRIKTSKVQY
jgi:hypothetical protein